MRHVITRSTLLVALVSTMVLTEQTIHRLDHPWTKVAYGDDRPTASPVRKPNGTSPRERRPILDGQPTRLFMTGNPHHPTFGQEQLAKLLDRYFDGKSPVTVAGLADARKDPLTQQPIPPAKTAELIRFLEPEFAARAKSPEPRERLVILNYVIINAPRQPEDSWAKTEADALQAYAQTALDRGASTVFFSEMVQPNHISGNFGNKFRRDGVRAFDELTRRNLTGIERGPALQSAMEQHRHFFRDDRHYSDTGREFIACLWLETLLKHDGRAVPDWLREQLLALRQR